MGEIAATDGQSLLCAASAWFPRIITALNQGSDLPAPTPHWDWAVWKEYLQRVVGGAVFALFSAVTSGLRPTGHSLPPVVSPLLRSSALVVSSRSTPPALVHRDLWSSCSSSRPISEPSMARSPGLPAAFIKPAPATRWPRPCCLLVSAIRTARHTSRAAILQADGRSRRRPRCAFSRSGGHVVRAERHSRPRKSELAGRRGPGAAEMRKGPAADGHHPHLSRMERQAALAPTH